MKKSNLTPEEATAIDNLKAAIKALPQSLHINIDDCEGTVNFWKRVNSFTAEEAAKPLKCRHALNICDV